MITSPDPRRHERREATETRMDEETRITTPENDAAPAEAQGAPTLVIRPTYEVRIEAFEGPMDLLLHLIREHEIDIYDIPIAQITQQYLDYLALMEALDLSLAGEFLEMAATLIRIKVQMLLPREAEEGEEETDPREELVRKLVEYKEFKEAARTLSDHEEGRRSFFPRGVDPRVYKDMVEEEPETEDVLRDVTLFDLVDCLREVLARVPDRIDVHAVEVEETTVEEQMERIQGELRSRGPRSFASLFGPASRPAEIVAAFIALLELIRLGRILVSQDGTFGSISISLRAED